jgi:hypothetical protein
MCCSRRQDLNLGGGALDIPCGPLPWTPELEAHRHRALGHQHAQAHLLEVEDDFDDILNHTGDGLELVHHAVDAHPDNCRPWNRGQQHPP